MIKKYFGVASIAILAIGVATVSISDCTKAAVAKQKSSITAAKAVYKTARSKAKKDKKALKKATDEYNKALADAKKAYKADVQACKTPKPASPPASPEKPSTPPVVETAPPPTPAAPQEKIINGKTLEKRVLEASDRLHTVGSGKQIRDDFPDAQLVYTDAAANTGFPPMILPFRYYYSQEADRTFNVCNIDLTVFICKGKLDHLMTKEDTTSGRCVITPVYGSDPRTGGQGGQGY